MKSLPYFKWYPADWDSDEWFRSLTDAEVGFYLRCLNHAWRNGGIPAESKERCRALKIHPKTDQAAFKKVSRQFHVDVNNPSRCVCDWLEEQRKQCLEKSVKAAESVRHRYERTTHQNGNVALRAHASEPDTEPDTDNTPKVPRGDLATEALLRIAGEIHARHPRRRDLNVDAVAKKLAQIMKLKKHPKSKWEEEAQKINANHETACQSWDWNKEDGKFTKGLSAWLLPTEGRYEADSQPMQSAYREEPRLLFK